jgi:predicted PurR-regulated permease PerM
MKNVREAIVWIVLAFLIFFIPVYTSMFIMTAVMLYVRWRFDSLKAFVIVGIPLTVVLLDNFVSGRQDLIRSNLFAFQSVLMFYIYRDK